MSRMDCSRRLATLQTCSPCLCSIWAKPTGAITVRGSGARIALWRACTSFRSGDMRCASRPKRRQSTSAYDAPRACAAGQLSIWRGLEHRHVRRSGESCTCLSCSSCSAAWLARAHVAHYSCDIQTQPAFGSTTPAFGASSLAFGATSSFGVCVDLIMPAINA